MVSLSTAAKEKFDRILAEAVETKSTPALFFGIATVDGEIYTRTAGTKLIDDSSSGSIDEDTVFWLCSQTKLITTIAALQLIEQGKITLDTPVEQILPELANPVVVTGYDAAGKVASTTPAKSKITFGQLLNHTSGLEYSLDGTDLASGLSVAYSHRYKSDDEDGVATFFKILKGSLPGIPLKFEPGTNFGYGSSSDCAGFIVERLSGKSLEQYFHENIFAPLGVKSASFYLTPTLKERLLPLSVRDESGAIKRWSAPYPMDQDPANGRKIHFGGVALYSSLKDYLTILRHLLQIKAGSATNPILSQASVSTLLEPTLPPAGEATFNAMLPFTFNKHLGIPAGAGQFSRALLVNTADVPGARRKGSGAWGGWANTSYFVDPATGVAAVLGTQLASLFDDKYEQVWARLQKELYSGIL
ncbi:beta-lactamase/transpeptidase-like protein [Mycena galericulata]|nr:beta-lactamase/transpeptidase-like protein [Mycena galericulata]